MIAFVLLSLPIFGVVALGWIATRTKKQVVCPGRNRLPFGCTRPARGA